MLRRLLGATLALMFVASSLQWSTPEAITRAARDHPWISDALWYGWLICAAGFLASLIMVCPTVVLLRRGRALVCPLLALTLSLSAVTTYLGATTSEGELSRHLWWSNVLGLVWLVSVAGLLLTVCVLAPVLRALRARHGPSSTPSVRASTR
jgi:NADH:ubiquinone oxidoreductase subunit 4 (subunit M)